MASPKFDNLVLNHSTYSNNFKGFYEKSASTVSDCYSSDDDYKEGILQDYLLNQSSVLLSHESVAFNGDQRVYKSNLNLAEDTEIKLEETVDNNSNSDCWRKVNNHILSLSNSNIPENAPIDSNSSEYLFDKCISEFYRPPSRSKGSCVGDQNNIEENASILVHHNIESRNGTLFMKTAEFREGLLLKNQEAENDNEASASLFKQYRESSADNHEDSTIKLISSGSLNSRTQSEPANLVQKIPVEHNEIFLDYEFSPVFQTELENYSHHSSLKKQKTGQLIKSTTQSSARSSTDQFTQTTINCLVKEKCVETNCYLELKSEMIENNCHSTENTGDCKTSVCYLNPDIQELDNNVTNLPSLLTFLQQHIDNIMNCNGNVNLMLVSDENEGKSEEETIEKRKDSFYSECLVKDIHRQLKHMFYQLDTKLRFAGRDRKTNNHQRHYSEASRNRDVMYGSGDFWRAQELDMGICCNKMKIPSLPPQPVARSSGATESVINCEQSDSITTNPNHRNPTCRVFELNPYDDLIKSYQSHTDRRIKAVGHKMKCQIIIDGPIRMYDSTNSCWNMRNKTAYRCSLNGSSKEAVEKCLKCLQDTFPQSCLNEKHTISKFDNKQLISS